MAERLWEELMLRMLQQSPDAHCLGLEICSPDDANQRDKWRGKEQKIIHGREERRENESQGGKRKKQRGRYREWREEGRRKES